MQNEAQVKPLEAAANGDIPIQATFSMLLFSLLFWQTFEPIN